MTPIEGGGGEPDRLAPVTSIFGRAAEHDDERGARQRHPTAGRRTVRFRPSDEEWTAEPEGPRRTPAREERWPTSFPERRIPRFTSATDEVPDDVDGDAAAAVPGDATDVRRAQRKRPDASTQPPRSEDDRDPVREAAEAVARLRPLRPVGEPAPGDDWDTTWRRPAPPARDREPRAPHPTDAPLDGAALEELVVKRLRTRAMSVAEVRTFLRGKDATAEQIDDLVADFERRGFLDDAVLAEQVVHTALTRKSQGRRAIGQALTARGIPRDIADAALAELPDDDEERAREYAYGKAASLRRLDCDTAIRRLVGQLSRRGFPGNVAMSVAREVIDG